MYIGSPYPSGALTGLEDSLTTYVLTMYNETAAATLGNIWGTDVLSAYSPNLSSSANTQYAEGSVIVKFAFVTTNGTNISGGKGGTWSAMDDAATWQIYNNQIPGSQKNLTSSDTTRQTVSLMQCDIIVKDSKAAPETGWVFSTLVYDKNALNGSGTAWDRMVPLGATWGNNPEVVGKDKNSWHSVVKADANATLSENWINMSAPQYSRSTLGWGGRLSGPNDGAVQINAHMYKDPSFAFKKDSVDSLAQVGCLGCHSSAQYSSAVASKGQTGMKSFLLPVQNYPFSKKTKGLLFYPPGSGSNSTGWLKWFQNRAGTQSMDPGQIALDYDMVTAFKAIPMWLAAVKAIEGKL
jgi:hypothetical protein